MNSEKKHFYRQLSALVLPIALQNLMTALVSACDALMLGFLDQASLSSVSLATQIQFVLSLFYAALTIGATVLAAQYWGKGDAGTVERVLALVTRYACAVSVVFFAAAVLFPGVLMRIFTAETPLVESGGKYLRAVSWSYLFQGVTQVYLCIMKNSGRAFRGSMYASSAVVCNILFNALLIFGLLGFPRMGVTGAALATVLARGIELALALWENRRPDVVRLRLSRLRQSDPWLRREYLHYTAPVLANELIWGCGFTMFSVIMGHMGSDAVAANAIASVAKNLIACVCLGIGAGSGILVGNALGSGELEQAKRYGSWFCRAALAAGAASGAVILLASPLVTRLAGGLTPGAQGYLRGMLPICACYMIGKSINSTVIAGIFCAGGDTKFGAMCDFVTMWIVIIPLGALAAFVLRLPVMAVYFLLNLDEFVKLPAVYRHYKKYGWARDLTKTGG